MTEKDIDEEIRKLTIALSNKFNDNVSISMETWCFKGFDKCSGHPWSIYRGRNSFCTLRFNKIEHLLKTGWEIVNA